MYNTKKMTKKELELEVNRLRAELQMILDSKIEDVPEKYAGNYAYFAGTLQGIAKFALSDIASYV